MSSQRSLAVEDLMENLKKVLNSPRRRPVYLAVRLASSAQFYCLNNTKIISVAIATVCMGKSC